MYCTSIQEKLLTVWIVKTHIGILSYQHMETPKLLLVAYSSDTERHRNTFAYWATDTRRHQNIYWWYKGLMTHDDTKTYTDIWSYYHLEIETHTGIGNYWHMETETCIDLQSYWHVEQWRSWCILQTHTINLRRAVLI